LIDEKDKIENEFKNFVISNVRKEISVENLCVENAKKDKRIKLFKKKIVKPFQKLKNNRKNRNIIRIKLLKKK